METFKNQSFENMSYSVEYFLLQYQWNTIIMSRDSYISLAYLFHIGFINMINIE